MNTLASLINPIANAFNSGGFWMWAILLAQIVSISIIIERFISLYVLRKPRQRQIAIKIEDEIKRSSMDRVLSKLKATGKTNPVSVVAMAGIQAAVNYGGKEEIQSRMDEVIMQENSRLNSRTGFLAMLANVGTLLGLLGTIVGLINAFGSVANVNPIEKAALLSQGISMAMNTTAYGLIMAIPALVMFSVLSSRANALEEDLDQGALKVFNSLSFTLDRIGKSQSSNKAIK